MIIAFALLQAATSQPIIVAPPPKWEDIPRPFRTAAEDCVWNSVQSQLRQRTEVADNNEANRIGQLAVAECDETIAAWAQDRKSEVVLGEKPEDVEARLTSHLASRGAEFAMGTSERFYIDEDRGENTRPSFRMSQKCEDKVRRALNVRARLMRKLADMATLEERHSSNSSHSKEALEFMADFEASENRLRILERDCPEVLHTSNSEDPHLAGEAL